MSTKHSKQDKAEREKQMLKVWAVLKRLRQERAPDWLKAMRKESRPEYNKLVDQCALFKAKHHKSDPLYALYRCAATQDGQCRFLALSPTAGQEAARIVELRNAKGEQLRHTLELEALREQVQRACGSSAVWTEQLAHMDHAQLLYWLWETQRNTPMRDSPKSPSTLAIVSLQVSEKRAYFSLEKHSTRIWGPVLVLREPSKNVASNLEQLNFASSRITSLLQTHEQRSGVKESKKQKRRDSSEKKIEKSDKHKHKHSEKKDKKKKKHGHKDKHKHKEKKQPVKKRARLVAFADEDVSAHSGDASLGSEDSLTENSDSDSEARYGGREGYCSEDDETFGGDDSESSYDSEREYRREKRARAKEDSSLSEDVIRDSLSSRSGASCSSSCSEDDDDEQQQQQGGEDDQTAAVTKATADEEQTVTNVAEREKTNVITVE